jgi:hypothetical protein
MKKEGEGNLERFLIQVFVIIQILLIIQRAIHYIHYILDILETK